MSASKEEQENVMKTAIQHEGQTAFTEYGRESPLRELWEYVKLHKSDILSIRSNDAVVWEKQKRF